MNSILQALAAVDPYKLERESDVSVGTQLGINRNPTNSDHYERCIYREEEFELNLMWEFLDLLKLLRSEGIPAAVPPFAFQFTFSRLSEISDYRGREEQDTAEYFCAFLNYLREHDSNYGEVFDRLFRIYPSEIVKCSNSSEVKELSDPSWYISLIPLPRLQTTTVAQAMSGSAQVEAISVDRLFAYNARYYDGCPYGFDECEHEKRLWLLKPLPDFLMLKFVRHEVSEGNTDWNSSNKLAYKVVFDKKAFTLDLSEYVEADGSEQNQLMYKLRAVIYHSGSTFATGHYFVVSRTDEDGSNDWWQCNDGDVSNNPTGPYPVGDLANSQAYMALYEKVQPDHSTVLQKQETEYEKEQDKKTEQEQELGSDPDKEQHVRKVHPKEVCGQEHDGFPSKDDGEILP
ncbi:Ubiquitin carboxyl-terminal hydrolase 26 [Didymosphaeria variabile]|uniref:Ubiquitin carboxyl-terminal hydrolase 26 n=1 Tax=Didymosphaeria variabile TaxID=1932322 RepID=A0A9W8XRD2_9PLEO|nr:Ubiquitin carboxyl-terminal hydrolase 26 [Didymosphaeria variabile]KAJ4357466.1 Ubiquitin carboxyl-terminal hydrolase 26 [Didymosphaeria variabile]